MRYILAILMLFVICTSFVSSQNNFWVNAYYPEFGDLSPTPEQIDFTAFTHITVFTTEATQKAPYYFRELPGSPDSGYFDGGYNHRLVNGQNWITRIVNKAHANGVKVIMCLGGEVGGNANNFSYMIADPARRAAYISYVIGFAHRRNIDGYDIDHEFTSSGETASLKAFFTELRAADPSAIITTAVALWAMPAYYNEAAFYNGNTVNQINIMAYREADGSSITGYNSPLFQPKSAYPNYNGGSWFNNGFGQGPYLAWVNKGINKAKIGMIIPFEMAHTAGNDAPGQSRSGWVQFANYSSVVAGKNAHPGSDHWDNEAKVPWVGYTDGSGKHFYSYENFASLKFKIDTMRNGGFGGIGIWELFRGYASNAVPPDELLQNVKVIINNGTPPPPPVPQFAVSLSANATVGAIDKLMTFTATAVNPGADSVRWFRSLSGSNGAYFKTTLGSVTTTDWTPTKAGSWVTFTIAYKYSASSTTTTSNFVTVIVPDTAKNVPPTPGVPVVSLSVSKLLWHVGDTVALNATGNYIPQFVNIHIDGVYDAVLSPMKALPATFLWVAKVGSHTAQVWSNPANLSGTYLGSNILTLTVDNVVVPPSVISFCDSAFKRGVASVDTFAIYGRGVSSVDTQAIINRYKAKIPNTVSTTITVPVTITVPKP